MHVEKVVEKKLSQAEVEKMKQEIETELRDNVTDFLSPSKLDQIKREAEAKAKAGQDSVGSQLGHFSDVAKKKGLGRLGRPPPGPAKGGPGARGTKVKERKATRNRNFPVHCTALRRRAPPGPPPPAAPV